MPETARDAARGLWLVKRAPFAATKGVDPANPNPNAFSRDQRKYLEMIPVDVTRLDLSPPAAPSNLRLRQGEVRHGHHPLAAEPRPEHEPGANLHRRPERRGQLA
jgi:hypothetical protein